MRSIASTLSPTNSRNARIHSAALHVTGRVERDDAGVHVVEEHVEIRRPALIHCGPAVSPRRRGMSRAAARKMLRPLPMKDRAMTNLAAARSRPRAADAPRRLRCRRLGDPALGAQIALADPFSPVPVTRPDARARRSSSRCSERALGNAAQRSRISPKARSGLPVFAQHQGGSGFAHASGRARGYLSAFPVAGVRHSAALFDRGLWRSSPARFARRSSPRRRRLRGRRRVARALRRLERSGVRPGRRCRSSSATRSSARRSGRSAARRGVGPAPVADASTRRRSSIETL